MAKRDLARPAEGDAPMRFLLSALLMTSSVLSPLAAAAAEMEGEVTSFDPEAATITLDDGQTYILPADFDVTKLARGVRVIVTYEVLDDERRASEVEIVS